MTAIASFRATDAGRLSKPRPQRLPESIRAARPQSGAIHARRTKMWAEGDRSCCRPWERDWTAKCASPSAVSCSCFFHFQGHRQNQAVSAIAARRTIVLSRSIAREYARFGEESVPTWPNFQGRSRGMPNMYSTFCCTGPRINSCAAVISGSRMLSCCHILGRQR